MTYQKSANGGRRDSGNVSRDGHNFTPRNSRGGQDSNNRGKSGNRRSGNGGPSNQRAGGNHRNQGGGRQQRGNNRGGWQAERDSGSSYRSPRSGRVQWTPDAQTSSRPSANSSSRGPKGSNAAASEGPMRLQRFLARAGVDSRRACEALITDGRVKVNGVVERELGTKVDPAHDRVEVDGREATLEQADVTLMLYKPYGYVTTMKDPQGRPCVADLIPLDRYPALFPVGRLDHDATGLLLFTTDGDLGEAMLHPRFKVPKTYEVQVAGIPTDDELDALRDGILLEDGWTSPAEVYPEGTRGMSAYMTIIIREGRKRQVKRMCLAIGHRVLRLHRSEFGPLDLGDLREGEWRILTDGEVRALKEAAGLEA